MENRSNISTKTVIFTGMFVAVLAVLSQLSIPMPSGVPITLQTFAVALTAYVLGVKTGVIAMVIYILLGVIGVPVFAEFSAGIGVLVGMTGGFLWGFIVMIIFCGLGKQQSSKIMLVVFSALGLAACHLLGIVQFMFVMDMQFVPAALMVSIPYLIKDALSVVAAFYVALAIRRALSAANLAYEM